MKRRLYHGGMGEMWRGDVIKPDMAEKRYHDGCAICQAHQAGLSTSIDPATPHGWVYATSDRAYARYYASRAGNGWLYEVRLADNAEPSEEDPYFPTWRAASATIERVLERGITLSMREREKLWVRWGGTKQEFANMVAQVRAAP